MCSIFLRFIFNSRFVGAKQLQRIILAVFFNEQSYKKVCFVEIKIDTSLKSSMFHTKLMPWGDLSMKRNLQDETLQL